MGRNVVIAVGAVLLAWFGASLALGPSGSGVDLNSETSAFSTGPPEPGAPTPCVRVHTYSLRGWGSHSLTQSNVWLVGCTDPAGHMRIASGPTCSATSFLGAGTASCYSTPDGSDLKVTVTIHYPFGLDWIANSPSTTTFRIDPGGGYNAP